MNLLRYRPAVRTVRWHGRLVKVSTSDTGTVQHVEDGDVQHATVRPPMTIVTRSGDARPPAYEPDVNTGLWLPPGATP